MKDLYTFDFNSSMALSTYHEVREVYARLFDELKIPYLVAEADSGDMGGNLSHEFHFPTIQGEDHIISCSNCNYVANEELVENVVGERPDQGNVEEADVQVWRGISRDKLTLINVWHLLQNSSKPSGSAKQSEVNIPAVRAIVPEVDASIENPLPLWTSSPPHHEARRLINLIDFRLPKSFLNKLKSNSSTFRHFPAHLSKELLGVSVETYDQNPKTRQPLNLLRSADGDPCPRCANGSIKVQRAIELGHTFYLGTRYSDPLKATVAVPTELLGNAEYGFTDMAGGDSHSSQRVPMQMGCHGIGVTRMIGAVADSLADEKGLNWPRAMAPFEAIIVASKGLDDAAVEVYDLLSKPSLSAGPGVDLVLDDRIETFAWKMRDADLVGYPIIIIVGRRWKVERMCEVQCRRLHICTELPIASVQSYITSLLNQL
jgi:prolyl-tRNA synthetase